MILERVGPVLPPVAGVVVPEAEATGVEAPPIAAGPVAFA